MLTGLQRKKLTRYFHLHDMNQDGRVGAADFERIAGALRALRELPSASDGSGTLEEGFRRHWDGLRASAELEWDAEVTLREWLEYWDDLLASEERFRSEIGTLVARVFEFVDTNGDGRIGPDEFCAFYAVYGLGAAMARRVFVTLDRDGDGEIGRDEMAAIGLQFYLATDRDAPGNELFGPFE